jgi:hexosaminidase
VKAHPEVKDFADLETLYEMQLLDFLKDQGTSYIVWQEIFDNGAKVLPDTIIDVWKGGNWQEEMTNVTGAGFKTVLSAPFYLNYISYGADWSVPDPPLPLYAHTHTHVPLVCTMDSAAL